MPQPFGSPENAGSSASWLLNPARSLSSKLRPASPHVKRKDDQGTHRGKQQAALLIWAASNRQLMQCGLLSLLNGGGRQKTMQFGRSFPLRVVRASDSRLLNRE